MYLIPPTQRGFRPARRSDRATEGTRRAWFLAPERGPAFASKWLVPRLQRFDAAHPDIDARISASLEVMDLDREGFDAAIRLGRGSYPGLDVHELFAESVVSSGLDLIEGPHPLRTPADPISRVSGSRRSQKHEPQREGPSGLAVGTRGHRRCTGRKCSGKRGERRRKAKNLCGREVARLEWVSHWNTRRCDQSV